jgi:hypothetical protein
MLTRKIVNTEIELLQKELRWKKWNTSMF